MDFLVSQNDCQDVLRHRDTTHIPSSLGIVLEYHNMIECESEIKISKRILLTKLKKMAFDR